MKDFDEFFKDLIDKKDSLYELIFSKLQDERRRSKSETDVYRYLGETNQGEWYSNIESLLLNQDSIDLSKSDIKKVDDILNDVCHDEGSERGFDGKSVVYPKLKSVQNSRFNHCWFLKRNMGRWGNEEGWDMCVQKFTDDWYLVNIGDADGSFNYWFICDEIDGLLKLIDDKFINV